MRTLEQQTLFSDNTAKWFCRGGSWKDSENERNRLQTKQFRVLKCYTKTSDNEYNLQFASVYL